MKPNQCQVKGLITSLHLMLLFNASQDCIHHLYRFITPQTHIKFMIYQDPGILFHSVAIQLAIKHFIFLYFYFLYIFYSS